MLRRRTNVPRVYCGLPNAVLSGLLAGIATACTSYEVINRPTSQDGIRYVRRETTFMFFVLSEDIMRCTETTGADTYCVLLEFLDADSTPAGNMPCAPTVCGSMQRDGVSTPAQEDRVPVAVQEQGPTKAKQTPSHAIVLDGKPLFELTAPVTTRLRALVGQPVTIRTIYGKDVAGELSEVSPSQGLVLRRGSNVVNYPWDEVAAVWVGKE